ncbi:MAG: EAL domain-containing protein [Gammaproteobacteria bacterium]|nr:EAL domain-containing protein [Gammaproteobacteria bacterium]MDH5803478.1 EAL domain-containing protein [Gammaproteobacteria bacterium]
MILSANTEKFLLEKASNATDTILPAPMPSEKPADGILVIDRHGIIQSLDSLTERMFGYSAALMVGKNINTLTAQPFLRHHSNYLKRLSKTGQRPGSDSLKLEGKRSDGSVFPLDLSLSEIQMEGSGYFVGRVRDLTEQIKAREHMRVLSSAVEQTADAIIITDRDGRIEYVNSGFEQTTGYSREDVLGRSPNILKSGLLKPDFYTAMWKTILRGESFRGVFINKRKNGTAYYEEKTITPLSDANGNILHFVSAGRDISEQMRDQERLNFLAHHDVLTELPNRLVFMDRLSQAINHARRRDLYVCLMFLDLDRFKNINDTLGHMSGDLLLKNAAHRLQLHLRDEDTVTRLSGDEFAILLTDVESIDDVALIAGKLQRHLNAPFTVDDRELFITSSMGIAMYPMDGSEPDSLLKNADAAMIQAKQKGDTYCFYTAEMNAMAERQFNLETQLRRALGRGEFELFYQAQFSAKKNSHMTGKEALLRWHHPVEGYLEPKEFLHLIEETNMIQSIGEWVLYTACRQQRDWNQSQTISPYVAVNISPKQLYNSDFFNMVSNVLRDTQLCPDQLHLEITENALLANDSHIRELLQELSATGVHIALDDFGTGYSSLSHLRNFPISCLKIDQSFVNHIPHGLGDTELARSIISLGKNLGMDVIAEGVETKRQLMALKKMGCMNVQGFYFSRPLNADSLTSTYS